MPILYRTFVCCIGYCAYSVCGILHGGLRPRPRPFVFRWPTDPRSREWETRYPATHLPPPCEHYMLVCAASFTARAYSSDRMPFSTVSRAPSPSAEERSIVKIRHVGFIHLTRRTLIYGAMKQRSSITAKFPLAPHVFSLIEQQSTLCLDSLLRVFILSLPRLFHSLSFSLPLSFSLSFLSRLCSLFFRDIVSSALFCFSPPLIDCYLLTFLKHARLIYFSSHEQIVESRYKLAPRSTWLDVSFQNTTILTTISHIYTRYILSHIWHLPFGFTRVPRNLHSGPPLSYRLRTHGPIRDWRRENTRLEAALRNVITKRTPTFWRTNQLVLIQSWSSADFATGHGRRSVVKTSTPLLSRRESDSCAAVRKDSLTNVSTMLRHSPRACPLPRLAILLPSISVHVYIFTNIWDVRPDTASIRYDVVVIYRQWRYAIRYLYTFKNEISHSCALHRLCINLRNRIACRCICTKSKAFKSVT